MSKSLHPYSDEFERQIPLFYLDIAAQNLSMTTATSNAWKYMRSIIETLRLDSNLNGNVELHWSGSIDPVDAWKNQIWTFILRCEYKVIPHSQLLYT